MSTICALKFSCLRIKIAKASNLTEDRQLLKVSIGSDTFDGIIAMATVMYYDDADKRDSSDDGE
jgi:hypothetical protein